MLVAGPALPQAYARDTVLTGVASWYGPGFHGRTTANGEQYNMHDMTAAHKSLKFGTRVKVTNENNGRSVVVRINDRGPYVGSRIIDLSKSAAQAIDMIGPGTASVTVEVLA
jgi:rare lipoprotein A